MAKKKASGAIWKVLGFLDKEEYTDWLEEINDEDYEFDDESEDIPAGCRACGGDYPNCTDSCPMYDN